MTLEELQELLNSTGIPFAHHHWEAPPQLPYGVWLTPYSNNFGADNITYLPINHVQIELYAEEKNPKAERQIEELLTAAGLYYDKEETYLENIRLYETLYEIEV